MDKYKLTLMSLLFLCVCAFVFVCAHFDQIYKKKLSCCVQAHMCSLATCSPSPRPFHLPCLLGGVLFYLTLCRSQQTQRPTCWAHTNLYSTSNLKHVVLVARLMTVPPVCWHRKQICLSLSFFSFFKFPFALVFLQNVRKKLNKVLWNDLTCD